MSPLDQQKHATGAILSWLKPEALAMLFLGFAAGLPLFLIFSTLSVWLREAGVARSAVTFFSWAALGYSFKFIWAPLVDLMPLPFFSRRLGRRRGWLLISQILVITAIVIMAGIDPQRGQNSLTAMALAAVLLGFSSATQDIVIDAYRIECAEESLQALLASMYIAGYRGGMLVAGAGALFLAGALGTASDNYNYSAWQVTYLSMAGVMGVGVVTTLLIREPKYRENTAKHTYHVGEYLRFLILFVLAALAFAVSFFLSGNVSMFALNALQVYLGIGGGVGTFLVESLRFGVAIACGGGVAYAAVRCNLADKTMVTAAYVEPIKDFFHRHGRTTALLILLLIGFYRLSDIVLGVVANVFYLDMGFSKNAIAGITKTFGLTMTLVGGFLGGLLTVRYGVTRILMLGAFLSAATNLLFMLLAGSAKSLSLLAVVIGADNLSAGIATTAFIAFLSSLTNISFTAVQYAIFSSMMTLLPKLLGGYSGTMVANIGYERFFLVTAVMGLPVLVLIELVRRVSQKTASANR
jgi:PAT family beta-lactamase induction signal transducer AmpG